MIFSPELLLPQFGGKFSEAWIADVRGIEYVKKKDVMKMDIPKLCDDIIEMLNYRDRLPEECLSLLLASRLVHGVIVLFDHKVTLVLDNIIKCSYKCRIPKLCSPSDSKNKDDVITSRKRKRKDKAEKRLPIQYVPVNLAAQDVGLTNVVPLENITINEVPLQAINELNDLQSEVLNFGDIGYSTQPGPILFDDLVFPMIEEAVSSKKQALNDVLTTPTKKRPSRDVLTTPSKKRSVEKPLSQFDRIEQALTTQLENQIVPPMSPVEIAENPVTTTLQNVETAVAPSQEQDSNMAEWLNPKFQSNIETGTPKKDAKTAKSDMPFCANEKSSKCINRRLDDVQEIIPECEQIPEYFTLFPKYLSVDLPNLLAILFDDEPHIDDHIYRKQQSISHVESVTGQKLASRHTIFHLSGLPSIGEATHEQAPHQIAQASHQFMVPIEEQAPFFADPNISGLEGKEGQVEGPHKQSHQLTVQAEVHASHYTESNIAGLNGREQFQPIAESLAIPEFVEPAVAEKSPFEGIFPQNDEARKSIRRRRHKYIRHAVKNWNFEEKGALTIEDVCPKPLNRFNVAATFGDLLTMDKHGYVVLIGNEHTLELEAIEKGPKLFN